jgi:hypothetical protein
MSDRKRESTEQLLAGAEALRGAAESKKKPSTRQLVRDSERMIGRAKGSGPMPVVIGGMVLLALAAAAYFFLAAQ